MLEGLAQVRAIRGIVNLKYRFGTSSVGSGGRRTRPLAFTEQSVAMLLSILRSSRALRVDIEVNAHVEGRETPDARGTAGLSHDAAIELDRLAQGEVAHYARRR